MTDIEKARKEIIKDGGWRAENGCWNGVKAFGNKLYRYRVETIVVKNNKEVFVKKKPNGEYNLPGGSVEPDCSNIKQAENECNEEIKVKVKDIEFTGITYKKPYCKVYPHPKYGYNIKYDGMYTEVYIATYDGKYKGKIDEVDLDPGMASGSWYSTKECFNFFIKEHREALLSYLKKNLKEKEDVVEESYISNYFSNKKFFRQINRTPDIDKGGIDALLEKVDKEYRRLAGTSKIKRERKSKDVSDIYHPIMEFVFPDNSTCSICLCFDDNEFSPGIAINSSEYGSFVALYPKFFKLNKDSQLYVLLHEFGHIRLNHLEYKNVPCDLFGNPIDISEYRIKKMEKGKAMYTEINADLYAILNGAKMYTILNHVEKDTDDEYDYRFTNAELSDRYKSVFKKYGKMRAFESNMVSLFDTYCMALYEAVYQNPFLNLSNNDKDKLYKYLYEFCIDSKLNEDKEYVEMVKIRNDKMSEFNEKYPDSILFKLNSSNFLVNENENFEKSLTDLLSRVPVGGPELNMRDEIVEMDNAILYKSDMIFSQTSNYMEVADDLGLLSGIDLPGKNRYMAIVSDTKEFFRDKIMEKVDNTIESLKNKDNEYVLTLFESLSSAERKKIPIEKFAIPEERKFPLDSKRHVKSAIKLFNKAKEDDKPKVAKAIVKAMEEYDIPIDYIGKDNNIRKYIK